MDGKSKNLLDKMKGMMMIILYNDFKINVLKKKKKKKKLLGILSECQTVWIPIRPDVFLAWSGLKLFAKIISRQS